MAIEYTSSCPFGHECESIKDGKHNRCALYICLAGEDPQTGKPVDEWRCSFAWQPILLVENAMTNRGQTAAIESFRNDTNYHSANTFQMLAEAAANSKGRLLTHG
jgi:hypothetical protein